MVEACWEGGGQERILVLCVGFDAAGGTGQLAEEGGMSVLSFGGSISALARFVYRTRPDWVLFRTSRELDHDPKAVRAMVRVVTISRVAILSDPEDSRECDRWVRRGCRVFLSNRRPLGEILETLAYARIRELTVIDRVFADVPTAGEFPMWIALTRREQEVVDLLRTGLTNMEISRALHVTVSTIEYHLRNLFDKVGARNRTELVVRLAALGQ